MINWLPNIEYNKESRFFTTKDIAENAEKLQTADKALRDIKRKRAIERATAESIDNKGDFKEDIARESLKRSGFGEEADTLVNEITSKKTAKTKENIDFRKNLLEAVAFGTVKQDVAEKLFGGPLQDTVQTQTPAASQTAPQLPPVASPESRAGGLPLSPVAQALIKGSQPQLGPQQAAPASQAAPVTTPVTTTSQGPSQSNLTPRYAQLGPMDFSQIGGVSQKQELPKFELSTDPVLRENQLKAASQFLSVKLPKDIGGEQLSILINAKADKIAMSQNQEKPLIAFGGDLAKWKAHQVEVASAIGKAKSDILSQISGQINTGTQLATGQMQATTARKTYDLKEGEVMADRMAPWSNATLDQTDKNGEPLLSQGIKDKVQIRSPQAKGAQEVMKNIDKMFSKGGLGVNDPNYRSSLFMLAKYVMRLKGLEASDQKMASMEDNLKNGINIDNIIDSFEGEGKDIIRKIVKEGYRGTTTDINTIRNQVRLAQQEFRDLVSNSAPAYNSSYFETFPKYGESNVEKQRLIDEKEKTQNKSKTAREAIDKKKKESKKTSSSEGL